MLGLSIRKNMLCNFVSNFRIRDEITGSINNMLQQAMYVLKHMFARDLRNHKVNSGRNFLAIILHKYESFKYVQSVNQHGIVKL